MTLMEEFMHEIPKLASSTLLLLLAWFVGNNIAAQIAFRQKKKESDLTTARDFHTLYGEFFCNWKLWRRFYEEKSAPTFTDGSRWKIFERASASEGQMESLLVRLACEAKLTKNDIEQLGHFRQLYQILRESIEDNKPFPWDSSEHPDYVQFKKLAPCIVRMIVGDVIALNSATISSDNIIEITSNRHEQKCSNRRLRATHYDD